VGEQAARGFPLRRRSRANAGEPASVVAEKNRTKNQEREGMYAKIKDVAA
jgi:hypothetical protein